MARRVMARSCHTRPVGFDRCPPPAFRCLRDPFIPMDICRGGLLDPGTWRQRICPPTLTTHTYDLRSFMALEAPSWLNPGDASWQMVAATLVGLMSIPGLAVLYGGVMQKRWSINSMMLTFAAFSVVLIVWVLWGFKMGFGTPVGGLDKSGAYTGGFFSNFLGKP